MNKVSVAFLAGMLLVMGCQSSTDQEPFGNTVQASGEIFIPGERMGDPRNIQIYQDYLVVSNRKANPLIDVFDLASGERKSSFLSAGRGPLECLSVDIQSDPDHGFLYAFDMSQRKGLRYDFEKILRDSTTLPEVIYQRSDDSLETAQNRLKVYDEQTAPLIKFYTDNGLLAKIDSSLPKSPAK